MKIGPKGRMQRVVSTVERIRGIATGPMVFVTTTCSTGVGAQNHAWRAVKTYCTAKKPKTSSAERQCETLRLWGRVALTHQPLGPAPCQRRSGCGQAVPSASSATCTHGRGQTSGEASEASRVQKPGSESSQAKASASKRLQSPPGSSSTPLRTGGARRSSASSGCAQ